VAGELELEGNDAMVDLDGLGGLVSVGSLTVRDHDSLRDLRGLSALQTVRTNLKVDDNRALPACEAEWLRDNVTAMGSIGGEIIIQENTGTGSCH
jgi:hypothetical protein